MPTLASVVLTCEASEATFTISPVVLSDNFRSSAGRSIDEQFDVSVRHNSKARFLGDQVVVAGSDLEETVFAVDIGGGFAGGAILKTLDRHRGFRDYCARGISDNSAQRSSGL